MPRPKKDGEKISLYLDKKTIERLRASAETKGQTLTIAMERAINGYLDFDERKQDKSRNN